VAGLVSPAVAALLRRSDGWNFDTMAMLLRERNRQGARRDSWRLKPAGLEKLTTVVVQLMTPVDLAPEATETAAAAAAAAAGAVGAAKAVAGTLILLELN